MSEAAQNYSRRIGDLIGHVQQTIDEVDRFLRGEMQVPPEDYSRVKRELMTKQAAAMKAMNDAAKAQQEILNQLDRGIGVPRRRASDRVQEDVDISTIKRLAGID